MGAGEVGDTARGVSNAVVGKENGSGIGDDKGSRGGKSGGTVAKTTKAWRKLEKTAGIRGEFGAREFFEEFERGLVEGGGER